MKTMKRLLRVIFTPACWTQLYLYSDAWDRELKLLLANYSFTNITLYTAQLGPVKLWIANHPYASFHPQFPCEIEVNASRATTLEAHDRMIRDAIWAMIPEQESAHE